MSKTPAYIANHIRTVLKNGGSAPHVEEVQWFFKQEVKSRGWYTGELRKVAVRFRRTILAEHDLPYLLQVADQLFRGDVLEEKVFAVVMLQGVVANSASASLSCWRAGWIASAPGLIMTRWCITSLDRSLPPMKHCYLDRRGGRSRRSGGISAPPP